MSAVLLLAVLAAGCGVEPGYETLDVRYDGVPINLDVVARTSEGNASAARAEDALANPEAPAVLAYSDDGEDPAVTPVESASSAHDAHRDPAPEADPDPEAVAEVDLQAVDSDARRVSKARLRALRAFRGLVLDATHLTARKVDCLVAEVARSGVNPVPMNRALRRALAGSESMPAPRYVALAQGAAAACGVTLSESLLR